MRFHGHLALYLFAMGVVAGCASTNVSDREILVTEKVPRPATIWVYNFAATPAEIPADSALAAKQSDFGAPQTAEQTATGRQVGATIATQLVEEIRKIGMHAERASSETSR